MASKTRETTLKSPKSQVKTHAVDLDGTLAYEQDPYDPDKIGPPIAKMVMRVMKWLKAGERVVILTARMNSAVHSPGRLRKNRKLIEEYCKTFIGRKLPVTSEKHPMFTDIWDNRNITVETNTGRIVGKPIKAAASFPI